LLLVNLFFIKKKGYTAFLAAAGVALAIGITLLQARTEVSTFGGMIALDGFSIFVDVLLGITGLLGITVAYDYLRRAGIERGEYYPLMLFSLSGMMLMAQASDLIVIFLAIELLSIPLYILSAFAYPRVESEESGIKYFLMGAFSSGFFVYGTALVYGATGSTMLKSIMASVGSGEANITFLLLGSTLLLVGLGFKVAIVPFHMWMPDVYQGAPTAVTAFMAAGVKVAAFAALLRVFITALPSLSVDLAPVLAFIAAATMVVGNLIAIPQTNIKRMLAYSSIAQAGYIFMAFVPYGNPETAKIALASALFYLVAYTITSFGVWAMVIALEKAEGKGLEIMDYAGMGRKYPVLALAMAIFMLSFTGLPPTLGFVGKFYLFSSVISAGYYGLAIIGVLTSLISAYYYLRVVVVMYMRDGAPERTSEFWLNFTWGFAALATVILSLVPAFLFDWAGQALLFKY
jgi:NADH-quinone oxidoreductase subunit N